MTRDEHERLMRDLAKRPPNEAVLEVAKLLRVSVIRPPSAGDIAMAVCFSLAAGILWALTIAAWPHHLEPGVAELETKCGLYALGATFPAVFFTARSFGAR